MSERKSDARVLDRLHALIESRRGGDTAKSWTARLLADGTPAIARKVGEESLETVIAALGSDKAALRRESADLLYHLLVLWADAGLRPAEVWAELAGREGTSGLAEKAARGKK